MASPNWGVAGANDTYALGFEASGNLQVEFTRNIKSFGLLHWTENRDALKPSGYFMRFDAGYADRILYGNGNESLWPYGSERTNMRNPLPFQAESFKTVRRNWGDILDNVAIDSAEFLLEEITQAGLQTRCMTQREYDAVYLLNNAAWGSNTGFVDGTYGGTPGVGVTLTAGQNWTNGTNTTPNAQSTIQDAVSAIVKATGGAVHARDLVLVIGPDTASAWACSSEIRSTFIQSQYAMDLAKGELNPVYSYGLPARYAGVRIWVDDTVYNSAAPMGSSQGYVFPKGDAYLVCRPEGKEFVSGPDGKPFDYSGEESSRARIISTVACMLYKDMDVKVKVDTFDELTKIGVSSNYQYVLTSPLSGFYLKKVCG